MSQIMALFPSLPRNMGTKLFREIFAWIDWAIYNLVYLILLMLIVMYFKVCLMEL